MEEQSRQDFCEKFKIPQVGAPYIEAFFTPQEIDLIMQMEGRSFSFEDVQPYATHMAVHEFLQQAYHRGVISYVNKTENRYRIGDFYSWLDVFAVSRKEEYDALPQKVKKGLDDWYFARYVENIQAKALPIPSEDEILPIQEVLLFIEEQGTRPVYLNYCDCRSLKGDCKLPLRTCITYRDGENTFADRGLSEKIDAKRAKEVILQAEEAGLMHTVNPQGICNCCGDCCYLFRAQEVQGSVGIWPRTKYRIQLNEAACIGCGKCTKRCHFTAFEKVAGSITVHTQKCVGCGICISTCPVGALNLEVR